MEEERGRPPRRRTEPFRLGPWVVTPAELRLERDDGLEGDDGEVRLQRKEMDLLLVLVERAGRPLSSEELRRRIWGEQAISDGVAKNLVWQLRSSLGESAEAPDLVETVPGVGYRLTVRSEPLRDEERVEHGVASRARWVVAVAAAVLLAMAGVALRPVLRPDPGPVPDYPIDGNPIPALSLPGRESDLSLGPTARELVFAWSEDAAAPTDLWRLDLEAPEKGPVRLTSTPEATERAGAWSPDGARIAFVRQVHGETEITLEVMPATGGASRTLLRRPALTVPRIEWTADGRSLYVSWREDAAPGGIFEVGLGDEMQIRRRTRPPADSAADVRPALSGRGDVLAFVRWQTPLVASIWILDLATGEETRRAGPFGFVSALDWMPGDDELLFVRGGEGVPSTVWTVAADGSAPPRRWAPLAGALDVGEVTVAGDGTVAYEASRLDVDIVRTELRRDGGSLSCAGWESVVRTPRAEHTPQLSPDGRRLAFLSDRGGTLALWFADLGGDAAPSRLLAEGVLGVSSPRWSPTGESLALALRRGSQSDLALLRPESGELRWITETPEREVLPRWSSDGRALVHSARVEAGWELRRLDLLLAGGAETLIADSQRSEILPEGRIAYTDAAGVLHILVLDAGTTRPVELGNADTSPGSWTVEGDDVFFAPMSQTSLRHHDLRSGTTRDVCELPGPPWPGALELSPDGDELYAAVVVRDESEILFLPAG